jgi:hypothetical protein
MAWLGVIAIYLFPCLADLLYDEEFHFGVHNPLDPWLFVSGYDDEVVPLAHDRGVTARRDLDRLETRGAAALAMKR